VLKITTRPPLPPRRAGLCGKHDPPEGGDNLHPVHRRLRDDRTVALVESCARRPERVTGDGQRVVYSQEIDVRLDRPGRRAPTGEHHRRQNPAAHERILQPLP
jgi:hypothetical protein